MLLLKPSSQRGFAEYPDTLVPMLNSSFLTLLLIFVLSSLLKCCSLKIKA